MAPTADPERLLHGGPSDAGPAPTPGPAPQPAQQEPNVPDEGPRSHTQAATGGSLITPGALGDSPMVPSVPPGNVEAPTAAMGSASNAPPHQVPDRTLSAGPTAGQSVPAQPAPTPTPMKVPACAGPATQSPGTGAQDLSISPRDLGQALVQVLAQAPPSVQLPLQAALVM